MKPGDVSQPIRGAKTFQIFKLEKLTTPVDAAVRKRARPGRREGVRGAAAGGE